MATHTKKHIQIKGLVELVKITDPSKQFYAVIKSPQGDCRFIANLLNGDEVQVVLPGRLKGRSKNKLINIGDFILIEKDSISSTDPTYFVLAKYTREERNKLRKMGQNVDSKSDEINDLFEQAENKEEEEIDIDDI
jgi:translation initiation factor IF-1